MEEMELQSVRSYFRSLQKVSQVKVLFIVQYIMLSSSSPGWTQTSHRLISAEDGWLGGKTPFFFDGKCKAFGHEPKKTHDNDYQGHIHVYLHPSSSWEQQQNTRREAEEAETHTLYHPELHYGSPVWVQCRECNHRAPVWRVLKVFQENQEDTWQGPHVQTAVTTTSRGSSCLMSHNNGVMWGMSLFYSRMIASGDLQLERFEIGSWKFQQGNSDLQCSINCINKSPTQFCLLGGLLLWKEGLS